MRSNVNKKIKAPEHEWTDKQALLENGFTIFLWNLGKL